MALARTLVAPATPRTSEEQLWRASEGNPFMIVETLRALARRPRASKELRRSHSPSASATWSPIVIERLGERSRRLVAVAAVIGRPFDFTLLERAAALGEDAGRRRRWRSWFAIGSCTAAATAFEFTHDRIREVVYCRAPSTRAARSSIAASRRRSRWSMLATSISMLWPSALTTARGRCGRRPSSI